VRYDIGDLVRVSNAFTNTAGAAADPTDVYMQYKTPRGETTTLHYGVDVALVKDSTGTYHVDVDVTESGKWWVRFYSTGTNQAASEDFFLVQTSQF
jgi:hypothetical protein